MCNAALPNIQVSLLRLYVDLGDTPSYYDVVPTVSMVSVIPMLDSRKAEKDIKIRFDKYLMKEITLIGIWHCV